MHLNLLSKSRYSEKQECNWSRFHEKGGGSIQPNIDSMKIIYTGKYPCTAI